MRYGVDEGVMLFIPADLADQENRIQHDPGHDQEEEDDPEHQQESGAPAEHDPADIQREGCGDDAGAEVVNGLDFECVRSAGGSGGKDKESDHR